MIMTNLWQFREVIYLHYFTSNLCAGFDNYFPALLQESYWLLLKKYFLAMYVLVVTEFFRSQIFSLYIVINHSRMYYTTIFVNLNVCCYSATYNDTLICSSGIFCGAHNSDRIREVCWVLASSSSYNSIIVNSITIISHYSITVCIQ